MNLINFLVADMVQFAAENNRDLLFIIKFIDYMLSSVELDLENEHEVTSLINNMRVINNLYRLLGVMTHYSDGERKAFADDSLIPLMDEPNRIPRMKQFRLSILTKYNEELIPVFEKYQEDTFEVSGGAE